MNDQQHFGGKTWESRSNYEPIVAFKIPVCRGEMSEALQHSATLLAELVKFNARCGTRSADPSIACICHAARPSSPEDIPAK